MIVGDVKAGTITVAAGARMRGQVEFGFEDKAARKQVARPSTRRRRSAAA